MRLTIERCWECQKVVYGGISAILRFQNRFQESKTKIIQVFFTKAKCSPEFGSVLWLLCSVVQSFMYAHALFSKSKRKGRESDQVCLMSSRVLQRQNPAFWLVGTCLWNLRLKPFKNVLKISNKMLTEILLQIKETEVMIKM